VPFNIISGIRTSSTLSDTPNYRLNGSETSGRIRN
jgi:hypothetical protein